MTKKTTNIIVAVDKNGGFSRNNTIPWHYPEDFAFFRTHTTNNACVMGRNTYNEIHNIMSARSAGYPTVLPNRPCYVMSHTLTSLPNAKVIRDIAQVPEPTLFIIGGKRLYDDALSYADRIYLTSINADYDCDMFFNMEYMTNNFTVTHKFPANHPDLSFTLLERAL